MRGPLTDDLRAAIRERKPALLQILSPAPEPPPARKCPCCGGRRWWLSTAGATICGRCHPPASPRLVAQWFGEEETPAREVRR